MTFYGPASPNETHYEKLFTGRQRFGNRSANMFFVRPARHVACPKRLKYMQDVKLGFIPYVEDSEYQNRQAYANLLQKTYDGDFNKTNGLGLYNTADPWRQELMALAQQVKSSLVPNDDQRSCSPIRRSRSSYRSQYRTKRVSKSVVGCSINENDEDNVTKRLLTRRENIQNSRLSLRNSMNENENFEQDKQENNEAQDAGLWLMPILCYILQVDSVNEAQDWLVSANPTEKRLAMELISRTMEEIQNHDADLASETVVSDQSSLNSNAFNNVYWPYKIWQKKERERQFENRLKFLQQSKSPSSTLPALNTENSDTCERGTSPLKLLTPAKPSLSTTATNMVLNLPEPNLVERCSTRNTNEHRMTPRPNASQMTDRLTIVDRSPPSRIVTATPITGYDRPSRRNHRVKTSLSNRGDGNVKSISATPRGKTPLI